MGMHVRVVGRGLDGEVHRQLHAMRLHRLAEVQELAQPTQLGSDHVVATIG